MKFLKNQDRNKEKLRWKRNSLASFHLIVSIKEKYANNSSLNEWGRGIGRIWVWEGKKYWPAIVGNES